MPAPSTPTEVAEQPGPAWSPSDLAGSPHEHPEKAEKVQRMFGSIARRYDLNNRLHSFGRDQAWRRFAVRFARMAPGEDVLDCACGTGDLTRAFADAGAGSVLGLDFTPEMLEIARDKRLGSAGGPDTIRYVQGDVMALPFEDGSFDVVSIAWGIRNVTDPAVALREMGRVLRPGGRLVILESSRPGFAPARWASDLYTNVVMPRTAAWISGDGSGAYRYLPKSVASFLSPAALEAAMREAGYADVASRSLLFGVCTCYRGVVQVR